MRRRSSWITRLALPVGMVAFAALGAGLVYVVTERMQGEAPRLGGPPPPGSTAVPILARPLPAFTQIELEHLVDPATGGLAAVHIPAESILDSTITSPRALVGRVLARDKAPGQVFSEGDLMPPGTRPGLVAGIPPGKRAVHLETARVSGVRALRRGDRFDLVASGRARGASGRPGNTRGRPVVENGVVVEPTRVRRSLTDGVVVEEVVVAIDPSEVAGLTAALQDGLRIDTFPRSGRGGALPAEDVYRDRSHEELVEIDLIRGTRRTVETAPGGPRPPAAAQVPRS